MVQAVSGTTRQKLTEHICSCGKQAMLGSFHPQGCCCLVAWPLGQKVEYEEVQVSLVYAWTSLKRKASHV
jgi:hypothetical protein